MLASKYISRCERARKGWISRNCLNGRRFRGAADASTLTNPCILPDKRTAVSPQGTSSARHYTSEIIKNIEDDGYGLNVRSPSLLYSIAQRFQPPPTPGTLILVRHGESEWNQKKLFTGWCDVDLSQRGRREVEHAARLLLERGYTVDVAYTSMLKRAIRSSWILLNEINQIFRPTIKSWRLNERMYGALEGLSKPGLAKVYGPEVVQRWRDGLLDRPPAMTAEHIHLHGKEPKYANLDPKFIPLTESLQDTIDRTIPLWDSQILQDLKAGRNVLIVAHANSLRGLVKHIDGIGTLEIQKVHIPNGIPLVYKFDMNMRPVRHKNAADPLSGIFLEKKGLLRAALEREEELARHIEGYVLETKDTTTAVSQSKAYYRTVEDSSSSSPISGRNSPASSSVSTAAAPDAENNNNTSSAGRTVGDPAGIGIGLGATPGRGQSGHRNQHAAAVVNSTVGRAIINSQLSENNILHQSIISNNAPSVSGGQSNLLRSLALLEKEKQLLKLVENADQLDIIQKTEGAMLQKEKEALKSTVLENSPDKIEGIHNIDGDFEGYAAYTERMIDNDNNEERAAAADVAAATANEYRVTNTASLPEVDEEVAERQRILTPYPMHPVHMSGSRHNVVRYVGDNNISGRSTHPSASTRIKHDRSPSSMPALTEASLGKRVIKPVKRVHQLPTTKAPAASTPPFSQQSNTTTTPTAATVTPSNDPQNHILDRPLLVIIRHGKTEHNQLGLFTGWEDALLATQGRKEALMAGKMLRKHGIMFDVVYTSWLSRAIETAWLVLNELDALWLPIVKTWRLNERMYGALTGLSKKMIRQLHGDEQFMMWRRGYDSPPPPISSFSQYYPGNDERYVKYMQDAPISIFETLIRSLAHGRLEIHRAFPKRESLKDCMERTWPYFTNKITPESIKQGKNVLIASSENAIRGLLMKLCDIPEERIPAVEIPTGLPLVYDSELRCIRLLEEFDEAASSDAPSGPSEDHAKEIYSHSLGFGTQTGETDAPDELDGGAGGGTEAGPLIGDEGKEEKEKGKGKDRPYVNEVAKRILSKYDFGKSPGLLFTPRHMREEMAPTETIDREQEYEKLMRDPDVIIRYVNRSK